MVVSCPLSLKQLLNRYLRKELGFDRYRLLKRERAVAFAIDFLVERVP